MSPLRLATAQLPITGNARQNGQKVRAAMRDAAASGARLILFPEGMLSGYAKNPIQDWSEVDWDVVREELEQVMVLAAALELWVVLGSAHPLTPPHRPHNSLYIISDQGELVNRYDKRFCSATETNRFYTPGLEPLIFEVDGFRFGCAVCVEINFPALFIEYDELGVDCMLLPSYPIDRIFFVKARAYAAIHNFWLALSVPSECADLMKSAVIGPDGGVMTQVEAAEGTVLGDLDRDAPELDIALKKARPWRAVAGTGEFYRDAHVTDPRSTDKSMF
ncbi:carbon-nitrogen hydrolase family protein [Deinococcus altitudinis]|uniref:carbon-nitrogen hydrolase family protein n=1 Tax=Deinococcus altitudinis TaxID=468914 RepID=UPI003891266C